MNTTSTGSRAISGTPRGVAISGIVFSVLLTLSLAIIRLVVGVDPASPDAWVDDVELRGWVGTSLNLIPIAGIAFLWFMAVLRNRIGELEDQFFATVFFGSGLLFVATLFASSSAVRGLLDGIQVHGGPEHSEAYRLGRGMAQALLNTFGMRMAAVFMFVTSTIGLRTGIFPRWVSFTGFASGLILLLVITDFLWIALIFPLWVTLISTYILISDVRQDVKPPPDSP